MAALTIDEVLRDSTSLTQYVRRVKEAQIEHRLGLTYREDGATMRGARMPSAHHGNYHEAAEQLTKPLRRLVTGFLKARPGATPAQFVLELKRGRVPSAGIVGDTVFDAQLGLAEIIEADPSLLDLI